MDDINVYIDDEDVVSAKNKSSITSRMKSIRTTYDDPNKRLLDAINKNDVENSLEILKNETIKDSTSNIFGAACYNGNTTIIQEFLNQGAKANANFDYPIRQASRNGQIEAVKLLAKNGADVSTSNNICFINAIKNDDLDMIKTLIELGVDIHKNNDEFLSQAASDLKPKIVDYLLSNGANIHADNDKALKSIFETTSFGDDDYEKLDTLKVFLHEHQMKVKPETIEWLKINNENDAIQMIEKNSLNHKLKINLFQNHNQNSSSIKTMGRKI